MLVENIPQQLPKRLKVIESSSQVVLEVKGARPLEALQRLKETLRGCPVAGAKWISDARVSAVLGSCPRSQKSFKSALRHWLEFIKIVYGEDEVDSRAFPPRLDDVLAWSTTFRLCVYLQASFMFVVRCDLCVSGAAAASRTILVIFVLLATLLVALLPPSAARRLGGQ
jgi:hypothetical protein